MSKPRSWDRIVREEFEASQRDPDTTSPSSWRSVQSYQRGQVVHGFKFNRDFKLIVRVFDEKKYDDRAGGVRVYVEDDGEPWGGGKTEAEAINNFFENLKKKPHLLGTMIEQVSWAHGKAQKYHERLREILGPETE